MSVHFGPSQAVSVSTRPGIGAVTTWESGYRRAVLVTDLVIIAVCLRVGLVLTDGSLAGLLPGALAGMTAVVLLGSFFGCRVWEQRVLGQGAEEFRRLGNAVLAAAVVLGLTALAVDVGFFRPWVFAVIPATGLCLLTSRYALRSMVVDAERGRIELVANNEGAGPLFKMRSDPRVTRVGAVLRRYSLDELPQLVNVVADDMSVVGPRPPLPAEVECYGMDARRCLLVKPGLTGLWQVSGRSDLTWEESVRLDLRYVENWSFTMDLMIVWKTASAVLRGNGAY